jgi:hypothetical protein
VVTFLVFIGRQLARSAQLFPIFSTGSKHSLRFYHLTLPAPPIPSIACLQFPSPRSGGGPSKPPILSTFKPSRHSRKPCPRRQQKVHFFALFCSFLHSAKRYLPSFQRIPRSCCKNTGVGVYSRLVYPSLEGRHSSLPSARCSLFAIHWSLFTVHFLPCYAYPRIRRPSHTRWQNVS